MKAIYKYQLVTVSDLVAGDNFYEVEMPVGARVINIDIQRETVCLWAIVDPEEMEKETRKFYSVGTGWVMPDETFDETKGFIGTLLVWNGSFVYHFWEDCSVTIPVADEPVEETIEIN